MGAEDAKQPKAVLSIGNFDGVHRGHAALIAAARAIADQQRLKVAVLSFDPHPASLLRPGSQPARLTSFAQRERALRDLGVDEVHRLQPTPDLLDLTPEAFIDRIVREHAPAAIVEGADFRFGKGRTGGMDTLAELGTQHGFEAVTVPAEEVCLSDHALVHASSTITRWLIEHGRVRDAAIVLGRDYAMAGTVVRGERRGRTIGYPTANLDSPCLPPGDGVYAGIAELPDGRTVHAAISVGTKPQFDRGQIPRTTETFLLGVEADGVRIAGLPEYGWDITLRFSSFLRDQGRFAGLDALLAQMDRDCARVRDLARTSPVSNPAVKAPA